MLWLTYDSHALTDGAGAQLQRILSIYLIAKAYGVKYIHTGIHALSYQGAQQLEANTSDPQQVQRYNQLFTLPSDEHPAQFDAVYSVFDIQESLIRQAKEAKDDPRNILFRIRFAGTMIDSTPSLLLNPLPFQWPLRTWETTQQRPLSVAVHIRRGELFVVDSSRMLPNSYYIECMRALQKLLSPVLPFTFHIYTEQLTKPTTITPTHHGICERIKDSVVVSPDDNHLEEFAEFKDAVWHINTCPIETLQALSTADILLASRSSFSYVAGILNRQGIILFHTFWHSLSPRWIPCHGPTDIFTHGLAILEKAKELT
jgi:hypothetical protein